MAQLTVTRSFNQMVTDTTQVRDVSEQMVLLEPDASPLYVITNAAKRKQPSIAPRFEWVEDQEVSLWGQVSNGATAYSSVATAINVADGTLFAVGDVCTVPRAASSATAPEVFLVTSVNTNTITVTRGIGNTALQDTIGATASIRILASAFQEDNAPASQRYTSKTVQISYCQLFKTVVKVTHTAASTKQYAAPQGERKYQLVKALIRHRSEIESAGLWSQASETLSSPSSRWTTMGWLSRVSTNKTSGGTLSITTMNTFSETCFRYGEKQKLLLCAPLILSALNSLSQNKLLTRVGDTVYGVKISRFELGLGEFLLANNYRMGVGDVGMPSGGASFASHAYSVDLPSVAFRYLNGGGDNLIGDTKLYENILPDGSTTRTDEYRTQGGWEIRHEKKHAWMYGVTGY